MRNFLIKLLGGVPDSKYKDLELKIKNMQDEIELMDAYKQFAESIYFYAGNYPAWKAQSEFRQLMHSCNNPVSDEPFELSHKKYVDTYLGRIVDAFQKLILKQKQTPHFAFLDIYSWDSDYLELARGKQFLADHSKKHN